MTFMSVWATLLPLFASLMLLGILGWRREHWARRVMDLPMAACIGLGLSSLAFFLWSLSFENFAAAYWIVEAAGGGIGWALLRAVIPASRKAPRRGLLERFSVGEGWTALIFVIATGLFVIGFWSLTLRSLEGWWDAWASWNLQARYFFRESGSFWRQYVDLGRAIHPLLLPCSTARLWTAFGSETSWVPASIAFCFSLATVFTMVNLVAVIKSKGEAYLAGLLICAPVMTYGSFQIADVPLSFFMLISVGFTAALDAKGGMSAAGATFIGLNVGLAVWTKNEGLLFLLCFVASVIVLPVERWRRRHWVYFGLTVLPFLLAHAATKFSLASGRGVGGWPAVWERLLTPDRYALIGSSLARELWRAGYHLIPFLAFYSILRGIRLNGRLVRPGLRVIFVALAMLSGYLLFYMISPAIEFLVKSSIDRLIIQIMPLIVLAVFVLTTPRADTAASLGEPVARS